MRSRSGKKKRLLSIILAILTALNTVSIVTPAYAGDATPANTWYLHSGSDETFLTGPEHLLFTTYMEDTQYRHSNDILILVEHNEPFEIRDEAYQLGTPDGPFHGSIQPSSYGTSTLNIKARKAMFAYLDVSATIDFTEIAIQSELVDVQNSSALFADHVVNADQLTNAPLSLNIRYVNTVDGDKYFAGVLGEIGESAEVNLTLNVAAMVYTDVKSYPTTVYSQGSVGMACGVMRENSSLVLDFTAHASETYDVISKCGAAGGLVGVMHDGASLTIANYSGVGAAKVEAQNSSATPEAYDVDADSTPVVDSTPVADSIYGIGGDVDPVVTDTKKADDPYSVKKDTQVLRKSPQLRTTPGEEYIQFPTPTVDDGVKGCAGGIVGWAKDATITVGSGKTAIVCSEVIGPVAAGGVIGRAMASAGKPWTLDLSQYDVSGLTLSSRNSDGASGGAIGMLMAEDNVTLTGGTLTVGFASAKDGGKYKGGLIGRYVCNDLTKVLSISGATVTISGNKRIGDPEYASGGLIGAVTDFAAYISVNGANSVTVNSSAETVGGGVVGDLGDKGSFLDVTGTVTIAGPGKVLGGVVSRIDHGVLRLRGLTDVSSADTSSGGQIVYRRDRGLVYALGNGSNDDGADGGWTLKRKDSGNRDDVWSWGEVLRVDGATLKAADILIQDETAHTVTLKSAPTGNPITLSTVTDFALTALNIQLNTAAGKGALLFQDTTPNSETLLATNYQLGASISLAGTGLTGLTRDNGENAPFTGTFDGAGMTLTLATGEAYGVRSNGSADGKTTAGGGGIYTHAYNGLFAKTENATFTNLTLAGTMDVLPSAGKTYYVGGLAAVSSGTLALTDCNVNEKLTLCVNTNSSAKLRAGGAIGMYQGTSTVNLLGGRYNAEILDTREINGASDTYFGGVIGYVDSTTFTIDAGSDAKPLTLAGSFSNTSATQKTYARYGGLIGYIASKGNYASRKLNITKVAVADMTLNVVDSNTTEYYYSCASLLGFDWLKTEVTFDDLTIGANANAAPSVTLSGNAAKQGGLVYAATGYWKVNKVLFENAAFTPGNNGKIDFGLFVCYGATDDSALYLEFLDEIGGANIDLTGVTVSGSKNYKTYDEIIAYSTKQRSTNIMDNEAAIVSLRPVGDADTVNMTGSGNCNTYQNQTTYGKEAASTITLHNHSRYYYNLDRIRAKASPSNGEKLLLWSLTKYAHGDLTSFFSAGAFTGNITGNCDMVGLSYYPVSSDGVNISNATVTFYNSEIEQREAVGNTDNLVRSTRAATQQYLMHSGILYDARNLSVDGLTLAGTVGQTSAGPAPAGSGFLVRGNLHDNMSDSTPLKSEIKNITLNGAAVRVNTGSGDAAIGSTGYAPLLVNKVGSSTELTDLTVTRVQTSGYDSDALAATSLIGDVSGLNINITFSDIALDARTQTGAIWGTDRYGGTTRSIFTKATLLNSFQYTDGSNGQYNYALAEDWPSSHRVTYGSEISGSIEYSGRQVKYLDQTAYTDPTTGNNTGSPYSFASGWLPYVASRDAANNKHELRINHSTKDLKKEDNDKVGCGKVNDPYMIEYGEQLEFVATIIQGTMVDTEKKICLPNDLNADKTPNDAHSVTNDVIDNSGDTDFHLNSDRKFTNGSITYTYEKVREYLAGAYYNISTNLDLNTTYPGLGVVVDASDVTGYLCKYAFRGVLFNESSVTITNPSGNPLIANSNGCVVRNIAVQVDESVALTQAATEPFQYYGGCSSYGAVIGKVMAGDTFLDNVSVSFSEGVTISLTGSYERIIPVGGFVGVVDNGCVVFRKISSDGLPERVCSVVTASSAEDAPQNLYVNPYVGRVIAGFVFSEGCTVDNGDKNYEIPQLNPGESSMLSVSSKSATIPNGQALWAFGAIINSGAGSATSASGDYISNNEWSGFRQYAAVRSAGQAVDYAGSSFSGLNKTPYIIDAYTTGTGARAAGSVNSVTITGDCAVPVGFRGIGNFYENNTLLRLNGTVTVTGTGNPTVTLDIKYKDYFDLVENNTIKQRYDNYRACRWECAGLGLINYIYDTGENFTISGFTVAGEIEYKVYQGDKTEYLAPGGGHVDSQSNLCVGGVVGQQSGVLSMTDVLMGNLTIEGFKHAGGLVGQCSTSNTAKTFTGCGSTAAGVVNVSSMFTAGGMIGHIKNPASLTITGKSGGSTVRIGTIESRIQSVPTGEHLVSAGGLAGYILGGSNGCVLTITNTSVVGASNDAVVKASGLDLTDNAGVGGLAGVVRSFGNITFTGCSMTGIKLISGKNAGGAIGWINEMKNGATLTLDNVTVTGVSTGDPAAKPEINGMIAGGVVGRVQQAGHTNTLKISKAYVSGYAVNSATTGNSNDQAAGGMIGLFYRNNNSTSYKTNIDLSDISVTDCNISTGYSSESNQNGIGGMIGAMADTSSSTTFDAFQVTGYNMLFESIAMSLKNAGLYGYGALIGSNQDNRNVRLVGVSVQDVTVAQGSSDPFLANRAIGKEKNSATATEFYGPNGYIIFADYKGTQDNTSESMLYLDTVNGGTDVIVNAPYVTVNPSVQLDGVNSHILTGDGMSATAEGRVLAQIQDDLADQPYDGNRFLYTYVNSTDPGDVSWFQNTFSDEIFSTFVTETGADIAGYDFAVLTFESGDRDRDNGNYVYKIINSYLDYLTNTRMDFGVDVGNQYSVTIRKMKLVEANGNKKFEEVQEDACLTRSNGKFVLRDGAFDSGKASISLIDVAFMNPANTAQTAYHLYVPVFVRKNQNFTFTAKPLSGTTYRTDAYSSSACAEDLGTPVTLCLTYTYDRAEGEWSGITGNYEKKLQFVPKQIQDATPELPAATTQLILVDKQTGKSYYASLQDALDQDGLICLDSFKSSSGEDFVPVDLSDLPGTTANEIEQKTEVYYLSIFTEKSVTPGWLCKYTVDCQAAMSAANVLDQIPAKRATSSTQYAEVYLGDVFALDFTSLQTGLTGQSAGQTKIVTQTQHVTATLSSTIRLRSAAARDALPPMYQSYQIFLTRTDLDGTVKTAAVSGTTVRAWYTTDGSTPTSSSTPYPEDKIKNRGDFIELILPTDPQQLEYYPQPTTSGWNVKAYVELSYNEESLANQFPKWTTEPGTSGTVLTARSVISKDDGQLTYSMITSDRVNDSAVNTFFSEEETKKAVLSYDPYIPDNPTAEMLSSDPDLVVEAADLSDLRKLGINPLDKDEKNNNAERVNMWVYTIGSLDYSNVAQKCADFRKVSVKIELFQKTGGPGVYGSALPLGDYLNSLTVAGTTLYSSSHELDGTVAEFTIDRPDNDNSEYFDFNEYLVSIPIYLDVKTGAALEDSNLKYANYKVRLSVDLQDGSGASLLPHEALFKHIIYTNARVIPDFID